MATILLAEDNEAVRLLTQAKLRHQFTVVTAANGRETLDILNRQHVDLIVADVMMPVMDGYQLVRTLRAEGNEIPVLFLTALQSMDSKREGFSSGIDDYLTKPVDYEELIWRIQALLRRAYDFGPSSHLLSCGAAAEPAPICWRQGRARPGGSGL